MRNGVATERVIGVTTQPSIAQRPPVATNWPPVGHPTGNPWSQTGNQRPHVGDHQLAIQRATNGHGTMSKRPPRGPLPQCPLALCLKDVSKGHVSPMPPGYNQPVGQPSYDGAEWGRKTSTTEGLGKGTLQKDWGIHYRRAGEGDTRLPPPSTSSLS